MGFAAPYELSVTPGNLKALLRDNDIEPEELILSGSLNSEDLIYIREGEGRIFRLKNLDLSKITLSYDDGEYVSINTGNLTRNFYLSQEFKSDTTTFTSPIGMMITVINVYNNNLWGFLHNNKNLKKVTLPNSIEEFGWYMFRDADIEEVSFPDQTERIPNETFYNSSINKVYGKNIISVGDRAFCDSGIKEFDFSNINELGAESFNRSKLQGNLVLNGMEVIPRYSFAETEISSVTIKSGTKQIGNYAFSGCNSLTSVELPEGIETLGDGALNSANLKEINLPGSLVSAGRNALPENFVNNMPDEDGVVYVGTIAYCIGTSAPEVLRIKEGTLSVSNGFSKGGYRIPVIKKIILPSSLISIEDNENLYEVGAFYNMDSLEEIEFSSNSNLKKIGSNAFSRCSNLNKINLPEGLLSLGNYAFYHCNSLKELYLPNSLERIGEYIFQNFNGTYKIEILNFPENLQYIGSYAFVNCRMPSTITLGQKIKEIEEGAFDKVSGVYTLNLDLKAEFEEFFSAPFEDSSLEKVNVKSTCEIIPPSFLSNCPNLEIVNFEDPESTQVPLKICKYAFSNGIINIDQLPIRITEIEEYAFPYVKFQQKVFNTSNLTFIGENAFKDSKGFEKVIMDGALKECWAGAFCNIETLKEVEYNLPDLITSETGRWGVNEGGALFYGSPVDKVVISANVQKIPRYCFGGLNLLAGIDFVHREKDSTPLELDEYSFSGCNFESLKLPDFPIIIGGSAFYNSNITELYLGGAISIGNGAFSQNYELTEVVIPSTVEYIGSAFDKTLYKLTFESREETKTPLEIADNAFSQASIIDLILPDVPTTIGYRAFYRNTINELHLGIGTTTIGEEAFQYNTSLRDINIPTTVTYIGENAFNTGSTRAIVYFYSEVPPEMGYSIVYPETLVVVPEKSFDKYQYEIGSCYPYGDDVLAFSKPRIGLSENEETVNYIEYTNEVYDGMPWIIENSDPEVVSVAMEYGVPVIKGLKYGYAELTARLIYDENITATCMVTVGDYNNIESLSFTQDEITLTTGEAVKLELQINPEDAVYPRITWISSDPYVADVSNDGMVQSYQAGTTVITASVGDLSATCEITVEDEVIEPTAIILTPGWQILKVGEILQIEATVYPMDATDKTIYWYSSDPEIATVSESGVVTGVWPGRVYIHAVCGDIDEFSTIDVEGIQAEYIILNPNGAVIAIGDEIQITATVLPEETTDKTIIWTSSDPMVASVSEDGIVKGLSEGASWIRATCGYMDAGLWVTVLPDAGVESILANPDTKITIYTLEGILVKKDCNVEELKSLAKGIYIINSGKDRFKISL